MQERIGLEGRRLGKSALSILHVYYALLLLIFALLQCEAITTAIATEFNLVILVISFVVFLVSRPRMRTVNATAKTPAGLFGGLDVNVNLPRQYSRTSNESSPGLHSRSVYPRAMAVAKGAMQTAFAIAPASIKADANAALD